MSGNDHAAPDWAEMELDPPHDTCNILRLATFLKMLSVCVREGEQVKAFLS